MKALLILIVLMVIGVAGFYYIGGIASMDPAKQAEEFHSKVKPGMTWEQVVDLKAPRKYFVNNPDPMAMGGRHPEQKWNRDAIEQGVKNGKFASGFGFPYQFTGDHAWDVMFDSQGKVVAVNEILTTKGLLEGKAFQR